MKMASQPPFAPHTHSGTSHERQILGVHHLGLVRAVRADQSRAVDEHLYGKYAAAVSPTLSSLRRGDCRTGGRAPPLCLCLVLAYARVWLVVRAFIASSRPFGSTAASLAACCSCPRRVTPRSFAEAQRPRCACRRVAHQPPLQLCAAVLGTVRLARLVPPLAGPDTEVAQQPFLALSTHGIRFHKAKIVGVHHLRMEPGRQSCTALQFCHGQGVATVPPARAGQCSDAHITWDLVAQHAYTRGVIQATNSEWYAARSRVRMHTHTRVRRQGTQSESFKCWVHMCLNLRSEADYLRILLVWADRLARLAPNSHAPDTSWGGGGTQSCVGDACARGCSENTRNRRLLAPCSCTLKATHWRA